MRFTLLLSLFFLHFLWAQPITFEDASFEIFPVNATVSPNQSQNLFLGCNEISLETIESQGLSRNSFNILNGNLEVCIFNTGKVKYFQASDTIAAQNGDLWTNFNFLVLGINGNGGYYGNCCFDNEYIACRYFEGADTLFAWIKVSTTLNPATITIHEYGTQSVCPTEKEASLSWLISFANPSEKLEILMDESNKPLEWVLSDLSGRRFFQGQGNAEQANTIFTNTASLPKGLYLFQISSGDDIFRTRWVKE